MPAVLGSRHGRRIPPGGLSSMSSRRAGAHRHVPPPSGHVGQDMGLHPSRRRLQRAPDGAHQEVSSGARRRRRESVVLLLAGEAERPSRPAQGANGRSRGREVLALRGRLQGRGGRARPPHRPPPVFLLRLQERRSTSPVWVVDDRARA
jgi:hypothetical protein